MFGRAAPGPERPEIVKAVVRFGKGEGVEIALPPAAAGFILSFDIGVFPELTAKDPGDGDIPVL